MPRGPRTSLPAVTSRAPERPHDAAPGRARAPARRGAAEDELVALVRAPTAPAPLLVLAAAATSWPPTGVRRDGRARHVRRIGRRSRRRARRVSRRRRGLGRARRRAASPRPGRHRVPRRDPRDGRRDADPERRRVRPGGGRDDRRRAGSGPAHRRGAPSSAPEDCGFAYRSSAFKREPGRRVVLRVSFALERYALSAPVRYAELAADARRRARRARSAGRRPRAVLGAAPRQGHGARPRRPRHGQRRLVLHQPDPRPRGDRRAARSRRRRAAGLAAARRPREDLRRLVDRARRLPSRPRQPRRHRDLLQARPGADQPRRRARPPSCWPSPPRSPAASATRFGVDLVPEPVFVGHRWD